MHVRQLVTMLGICLSHAQASVIPVASDGESIKSIVRLVTTPHEALGTIVPGLDDTQKAALRESPDLYIHQLGEGLAEASGSLVYLNGNRVPNHDFTAFITASLAGYLHTMILELPGDVRHSRLKIFRNSLYSRLHDLATNLGPEWSKHAQIAQKNLEIGLQQVALNFEKKHIAPAGDKEVIEAFQKLADKIKHDHRYHQVLTNSIARREHLKSHLPYKVDFEDMNYLTKEEVYSQLKATNHPGYEDALFFARHEPAHQSINSPAPTHANNAGPAQLPPSPPTVTAAA